MTVLKLFKNSPALTRAELRPYLNPHRLAQLVGQGALRYDGRGVYQLPRANPRYAIAKELFGVLSHRSAASHWGLDLTAPPTAVDVTVSPNRSNVPRRDDAKIYYRKLRDEEQSDGVTTILRTLLDCARDLPAPDALAMLDSAVRSRKVDHDELISAARALRGPGSGKARRAISWIDTRSGSVLESVARGVLLDAGITGFEPQFPVTISGRRVRHADLGHRKARVLIEADGAIGHSGKQDLEFDSIRYTEFAAAGYVLIRVTWSTAMERRSWLARQVKQAVDRRL